MKGFGLEGRQTGYQELKEFPVSDTHDQDALFEEQLQALKQYYVLSEEAEVQKLLRSYPFLAPFLLDAASQIQAHFPDAQVFLHTTHDVEAGEHQPGATEDEELVAYISTRLPPREAIETLKQFYRTWWSQASKAMRGKISIGLECL